MATLARPEWVAADQDGYVAAATALARNVVALRASRTQLRAQMAASPLCDIGAYVAHFEALLQRMWALHCEGDRRRLILSEPAVTT
jgi:protein O-GlcNAc transferase